MKGNYQNIKSNTIIFWKLEIVNGMTKGVEKKTCAYDSNFQRNGSKKKFKQ
jgi:hypothetical protein